LSFSQSEAAWRQGIVEKNPLTVSTDRDTISWFSGIWMNGWAFAMIDINKIQPAIAQTCRQLSVKRLGLFGSVLTEDFSDRSDVDVLVIFDTEKDVDWFDRYFSLKEKLEEIFQRQVDLVVDKKFRNPVFQQSVDRTRTVIYER